MEQRTVKVSKIRITKSDLLSMCENERVFFIQSGDLLNDLNVFSKLLMFCMNRQRADNGVMKTARDIQTACLIRILAGKLCEGSKLIKKRYNDAGLYRKYDGLLEQSAKRALEEIKTYFSGKDLISAIRNNLAFHYVSRKRNQWHKKINELIENTPDSQVFEIYVLKAHGNCLFPVSNAFVIGRILKLTGASDINEAWMKLLVDFNKVINWFIDFLNDYHLKCSKHYLDLKLCSEEEIPAPSIKNVSLPYYTTD